MTELLQAVSRASSRAQVAEHEEMRAGLNVLATIASLAPWIGLLGTALNFSNAFQGISGQRGVILQYEFASFAESMSLAAFGLLIGLIALWSYRYLADRLCILDQEMDNTRLDLLNQMSRFPTRLTFDRQTKISEPRLSGAASPEDLAREQRFSRACLIFAGVALAAVWCIQAWRYFDFYAPFPSAAGAASIRTLFRFGLSCLPAYLIWVLLLRRRPGALLALASVLCACWSAAGSG